MLLSIFSIELVQAISSSEKFIPATSYTTKKGLLSNDIQDIIQDEKGFLWIATTQGLNRFDSKAFDGFVYNKLDVNSIPDNYIENLLLMPNGKVWLSILETGISIFDTQEYKVRSEKNSSSTLFELPNNNFFGMARDKNNNIWFSLFGEGIYQWNTKTKLFSKHLSSDDNAWLNSKKTFEIFIDSSNRLWVCTIDSKVYWYDIDTGKSKEFTFSKNSNDPLSNPIFGFAQSGSGVVFAGGYSGVYQYNEKSQEFDLLVSDAMIAEKYNGERTSVRRLLVDSKDNLWIGTTKSLLQLSNNKLFKVNLFEDGELFDKTGWTVHSMIEAKDGNIWIGTEGIGLLKVSSDWNRYHTYISSVKEPKDIRKAFLYKNNLWVVHPSSKIDMLKIDDDKFSLVNSIKPYLGESQIRIDTIFQDSDDYLWVSSVKGIHRINSRNGESKKILSPSGKELGNIRHLFKSKNGKFYFSVFSEGVGYFDTKDLQAHLIDNTSNNHLKGTVVYQIADGYNGQLWIATDYGIETLNLNSGIYGDVFKVKQSEAISSFFIQQGSEDVWAINDGSLILLNWNNNKLTKTNNDYMSSISTLKLEEIEKQGDDNLYISTYEGGLIVLNIKTLKVSIYTQENGLPSNNVIKTLFYKGKPIIVTESGVVIENPEYKEQPRPSARVEFDKISLGNRNIPLKEIQNLVLDYNYGSINVDMALLSYTDSSTFEYQYRLQGATKDWINAGNDNKFAFLNLEGGEYNFQVKGRSNYGKWSEIAEFPFVVKAAPWKTIWAYLLYAVALLLILSWFSYLYRRKMLYELEISKKQAQKELADAASKAKSDFLARVSHEVRTPLNGVLGMSELLLDTPIDEEQKIYADTIHTSGKHLLEIINDILDLSKIEAGKLELEELPFDLLFLVDEVCTSFISQTRQKQLKFSCCFDHNTKHNRLGDSIRIKQILFNLLSNAFKFTKEGEVFIKISCEDNSEVIVVSVADTGTGIDDKIIESLFEPFVQADSAITRKYGGTGLGLAICKQLTDKMNGEISVDSKISHGTTFIVKIPLKLGEPTKQPKNNASQISLCLLLNDSNLRQSVVEFCHILKVSIDDTINENTRCLFIDHKNINDKSYGEILHKAQKENIKIIAVGFEMKQESKKFSTIDSSLVIIPPPLTFKKMSELCLLSNREEGIKQTRKGKTKHSLALKLLVVEDNIINQQVSIEMLEKMGHMVDIVDNAEEALTMLHRNTYDMLFLDYHLPGMNGFQLVQQWDNINQMPVFMVTADLTDDVLLKCQQHNINEIIPKPFSQKELYRTIKNAMH